jgi:proline iminopeptidase
MGARSGTAAISICPNGSHMSMYDDQQTYMKGLIKFIKAVDAGKKSVTL